jgi:hypothetical protein
MLVKKRAGGLANVLPRTSGKWRLLVFACMGVVIICIIMMVAAGIVTVAMGPIPALIQGLRANPERIVIDIAFENFKRLEYKREIALADGILICSDEDYVPATIRYRDRAVDVRLRLKGDWVDHLRTDKWSFRIQVRGDDTLFGMKRFSIQAPETRRYVNEWLWMEALRKEGVIAPRYGFIDVTVNGEPKGIYAIEEHFDKRLVEYNEYREGPILKLNEDIVWADRLQYYPLYHPGNPTGLQAMSSSEVDVFQRNRTMEDPALFEEFNLAKDLLESFRIGQLQTHDVFDMAKLAKFMAVSELMGAAHTFVWHNLRLYYNPVTSLLEPVAFDGNAGLATTTTEGAGKQMILDGEPPETLGSPFAIMFHDPAFFEEYNRQLERLSDTSYLDNLFSQLEDELTRNIHILYRDYPWYGFSKDVFYQNQDCIRKSLNPVKGLHAYFDEQSSDGTIVLSIGNIQSFPLEVLGISCGESELVEASCGPPVLQAKSGGKTVQYARFEFAEPEGFDGSDESAASLRVNWRILATSTLRTEAVLPWPYLSDDFPADDLVRQEPNVGEFDFVSVDDAAKTIAIGSGDWVVGADMVIPSGYTVLCEEGTRLDLRDGATILSYSPLRFVGTEDFPVFVGSSDATGEGIVVLNAEDNSTLTHVVFENLSVPSEAGWGLTGAITFYESPVIIDGCQFLENKAGDDMLNIMRCGFEIRDSLFKNTLYDALDVDFGTGPISGTSFVSCGNDAIDVSGATVTVTDCFINETGDKGISVGENSQVTIARAHLEGCYIAVASKDTSDVTIQTADISGGSVGLAVYQKKSEFGPASMTGSNLSIQNVARPYLVEVGSTLVGNGMTIAANESNVWELLYGEE